MPLPLIDCFGLTMTMPAPRTWIVDERREAIERPEDASLINLVPGAVLRPLAGGYSGAINLFTGLLTLDPKASYPIYARPFTEVLILLDGDVSVEVEDRRYRLKQYDALTVSAAGAPKGDQSLVPPTCRAACLARCGQRPNKPGSMAGSRRSTSLPARRAKSGLSSSAAMIHPPALS